MYSMIYKKDNKTVVEKFNSIEKFLKRYYKLKYETHEAEAWHDDRMISS